MHLTSLRQRSLRLAAIACLASVLGILVGGSAATAAMKASASSLTGSWSGTYGGTYSGTFKLHWTQSAATLRGTITITNKGQSAKTTVIGRVSGTGIKFGAVGPVGVITYTGSVSGSSMSGHYTTPKGGGSWRAHKTS